MCTCSSPAGSRFGLPQPDHVHRCLAGELPMPRRTWLAAAGSTAAAMLALPSLAAAKLYGSPVHYDYITSGVLKGSQTTIRLPDGSLDVRFEFTDRGRGPKVRSVLAFDDAGFIRELRTTGHDYLKVPVDERFSARNGTAAWKNVSEKERRPFDRPRFYVSMTGTPEESAALARAMLRGKKIALWPSGEATVAKLQTVPVATPAGSKRVTMYELGGLDFSPSTVWLDEDGALFMAGSEWGAVIPRGWKPVLPRLIAAQHERAALLGKQIAATVPQRSATAIAIVGATLFDAESGGLVPNTTVVMKNDSIVAVGSDVDVPSDARRIDGAGKTVLPGLWNMHMHMDATFGPRLLAEGVTTIRDPGNDPAYISKLQRQFASGELAGPRVIIAGLMDGKGKYTAPIGTTTDNAAQAIAQVRDWQKRGAVQIKMYSSLDPKLVPVIAGEAHRLGMRVSGHVPAGMIARDAIDAGFDEIQHVNMLFLNFMPDVKDRTQTPVRLTAPALRAGTIDLQSQAVKDFIALMKRRDVVSDPTVGIFYQHTHARPGDLESSGFAEIAEWLPAQVRRGLLAGGLPSDSPAKRAAYAKSADAYLKMVALLHENGIRIVAGTDDVLPGFDTVFELELYAKAGIPNAAVLQTATIVPARVMKMDAKLGSVRSGKLADVIVVAGNPLENVSALRNVKTTIKGGVMHDSRALYATAGVRAPAVV
jgi:imidazolonepropionase-like amidohydrolase